MKIFAVALVLFSQFASAIDFKISKGNHYSFPLHKGIFHHSFVNFKAAFNESAIYDLKDADDLDKQDVNKLYGFSDCGDGPKTNSARFGWRWYNNQLQIMTFVEKDGQFVYDQIGVAELNRVYEYKIELSEDKKKYVFTFNNNRMEYERGCSTDLALGWILQPYFGGTYTSPQDIVINMDLDNSYANFAVSSIYPNPVAAGANVKVNLQVEEDMDIGFKIYDMAGRLVQVAEFSGNQFTVKEDLATGMYLVSPFAIVNGEEKPGMVMSRGDAFKLLVFKR